MAGYQMTAVLIAISVLLVNTSLGSWHTGSFELGLKTPHNVGFGFDPFANVTVSKTCRADVEYYFHQLNQKWKWPNKMHFHDWSFQMMDSTGKISDGFSEGNFLNPGNQLQCMAVKVNETERKLLKKVHHEFIGTYHLVVTTMLNDTLKLQNGVCAPSTCTKVEVAGIYGNIRRHYLLLTKNSNSSPSEVMWTEDNRDDKKMLDNADRAFIIFLTIWGTLLLCGTIMEYWLHVMEAKCDHYWQMFLLGFGVYKSVKSFTSIAKADVKSGKERLGCLDGIRFISISWVALGHTTAELSTKPMRNSIGIITNYVKEYQSWNMILNGFWSVDSFFCVSGCLVTYLTLKEMEKSKGKINLFFFYLHRYLRLTGSYAFVIFFHATLYDKFFPNWPSLEAVIGGTPDERSNCRNFWWTNILYINNFLHGFADVEGSCIGVSWYLANDMQYFLITPLIFMPLFFFRMPGLIWSGLVLIGATAVPIASTFVWDWPASSALAVTPQQGLDYNNDFYVKPWNRFVPYMTGLLLGYILHVTKKPGSFKMPGPAAILIWIMAFATGFSVIFGLRANEVLAKAIDPPSTFSSAMYQGLGRLGWSLAICWVIFSCSRGFGGWINDFLSWEAWQPLSKVSFIIYLIHYDFITILLHHNQFYFPQDLTPFLVAVYFLCVIFYTTIASIGVYVFVETPWLNTEKLLMGSLAQLITPSRGGRDSREKVKSDIKPLA